MPKKHLLVAFATTLLLATATMLWLISLPWYTWHRLANNSHLIASAPTEFATLLKTHSKQLSLPPKLNPSYPQKIASLWPLTQSAPALAHTIRDIAWHKAPYRPLLITPATLPATDQPHRLVIGQHEGTTTLQLSPLDSPPTPHNPPTIPPHTTSLLTIPGPLLQLAPEPLLTQWDTFARDNLGFTHTQPNIIRFARQFEHVSFSKDTSDTFSLTVIGAPDIFKTALETWLTEEERRTRPVTHTFRLPDGSVGQELVPGPIKQVLTTPDTNGCQTTVAGAPRIWLCQNASSSTVSSTAITAPSKVPPTWHIYLTQEQLAPLCQLITAACGTAVLNATGTDTSVQVILQSS